MNKHTGRIGYRVRIPPSDKPNSCTVWIVADWGGKTDDGTTCLSAELKTEDEIDFSIRDLKHNLDDIGKRAKMELKQANESVRKTLFDRAKRL